MIIDLRDTGMSREEKRDDVQARLIENGGRFFNAIFWKRTTGKLREMRCQFSPRPYSDQRAAVYSFNPFERFLIPVVDTAIRQKRQINIDGLEELEIGHGTVVYPVFNTPKSRSNRPRRRKPIKKPEPRTAPSGLAGMSHEEINGIMGELFG